MRAVFECDIHFQVTVKKATNSPVGVLWLILSERVFILPCLVLFENEMLTRRMNLLVKRDAYKK